MRHKNQPAATTASVVVTTLLRVNDGDTFYCNINKFPPLLGNNIGIRVRGIDAPELSSKDDAQRSIALAAKRLTHDCLWNADEIVLKNLSRGKYFRIIADVYYDGTNLALELLKNKLVLKY